jgi:hypothetical protein
MREILIRRGRRWVSWDFFDADKRLEVLSARGDPLEAIDHFVPWESFRAAIEAVVLTPDELKKSSAGRKPFDAILMFRMLVLQALNNRSDEQVELSGGPYINDVRGSSDDYGHVNEGSLKALASGSAERPHIAMNLPTIAEAALPNFEAITWFGLTAPAGTPRELILKLAAAANGALKSDEVVAKLQARGLEPLVGPPDEFATLITGETSKYKGVAATAAAGLD